MDAGSANIPTGEDNVDTRWRIELLGPLRAVRGETVITRWRARRFCSLLAYLAYYRDRTHLRKDVAQRFWPPVEAPREPATGRKKEPADRHYLRTALSSLRRQLEPPGAAQEPAIVADRASVRLNPDLVFTDVAEFRDALRAAAGAKSQLDRGYQLARAVELYRGELLPEETEEWVSPERARLAE